MPASDKILSSTLPDAVKLASAELHAGRLIVYPTETFYGLGADARSKEAVEALIRLKGREPDKPLPVIVPPGGELQIAAQIRPLAARLIERYWPGPLTLVFAAQDGFPASLYGPGQTIGARVSSGVFALALSQFFGGPIVSTSANLAGGPPASTIEQLPQEIIAGVGLIIDGGELPGKLGSTIIDVSGIQAKILRHGEIDPVDLNRI